MVCPRSDSICHVDQRKTRKIGKFLRFVSLTRVTQRKGKETMLKYVPETIGVLGK